MNRKLLRVALLLALSTYLLALTQEQQAGPQTLRLPLKDGSVRFAVIGDTGTASQEQYDVGKQMAAFHAPFPFDFVIMVGDNIYGAESPRDLQNKFELPYKALLDGGVKFYASLGNHDNSTLRSYKPFNMGGQRFYTFKPKNGVRLFALDTTYMDKPQLDWVEKELAASGSEWKICYFHHPLYSSGRTHGSSLDLRALLEPIFVKEKVDVVFSGHDHVYERVKPQQGIHYFVTGAGGSLRKGDLKRPSELTDFGFDQDFEFMLVEIAGQDMYFQTITRTGQTIDSGVIHKEAGVPENAPAAPLPPSPGAPVVSPAAVEPTPSPQPSAAAATGAKPSPQPSLTPPPRPTPKATPRAAAKPAPRATPTPKPSPTPSP
jgi:predicted phosphodiesterase